MFDIKLKFDDISISSIEKENLEDVYKLISRQKDYLDYKITSLKFYELYESFLEYYLGECEFFLKIVKNDILIGVIRGCVEFKNPNEVWFKYFFIDKNYSNQGIGSRVLRELINYFSNDCSICKYYCIIYNENFRCINFCRKNKFFIEDFLDDKEGRYVVLKKLKNIIIENIY